MQGKNLLNDCCENLIVKSIESYFWINNFEFDHELLSQISMILEEQIILVGIALFILG